MSSSGQSLLTHGWKLQLDLDGALLLCCALELRSTESLGDFPVHVDAKALAREESDHEEAPVPQSVRQVEEEKIKSPKLKPESGKLPAPSTSLYAPAGKRNTKKGGGLGARKTATKKVKRNI